jgi:hypothetical protein
MTVRNAALRLLQVVATVIATVIAAVFALWLLVFIATLIFDPGYFDLTPEQRSQ